VGSSGNSKVLLEKVRQKLLLEKVAIILGTFLKSAFKEFPQ
jgi:hypothetical protein